MPLRPAVATLALRRGCGAVPGRLRLGLDLIRHRHRHRQRHRQRQCRGQKIAAQKPGLHGGWRLQTVLHKKQHQRGGDGAGNAIEQKHLQQGAEFGLA